MDLASVVAALASVGVRVSGSTPNNNIQGDSSRACPTGLASPEPSGTLNDPGQHFQILPTKDAIDTWDLGPNICHLPSLMVASSYFSHWRESDTRMGQNGNIPQIG